uniref:ZP domain-containing protein n=1 Tax=Brugia timori TaxID=42155 RepID=A0A0R3Q7K6_9BILA
LELDNTKFEIKCYDIACHSFFPVNNFRKYSDNGCTINQFFVAISGSFVAKS